MKLLELYTLIEDHFGEKAKMLYQDSQTREVACLLYESFLLKCNLDERYGQFGAGIDVGNGILITDFLGKKCSLNSDSSSIKESLNLIDRYCRLKLPDKFLTLFE
jgi:hypothetical protein